MGYVMTSRSQNRPNIRAVANRAGVSTATVSRAINSPERLDPETLKRVMHVVQELGYVPNLTGRSLVMGRTHAVGVVVPNVGWPLFASFARGIEMELNASTLMPIIVSTDDLKDREKDAARALVERSVDGLIIISSNLAPGELERLAPSMFRVHINPQIDGHTHQIRVDDEAGGYLAADHFLKTGHKRIAHVAGEFRSGRDRARGFLKRLHEEGLEPFALYTGDFTVEAGEKGVEKILETGLPDAIFAASDLMAVGVCRALNRAGLRVPDAVSVIGFDDNPIAALLDPPLTTLRQLDVELGRMAGRMFLSLMEGERPENQIIVPELIERHTTRMRARR
ncbi:LacI family transcriptional regulator [Deinococcus cellulosilyticus NBRC 106333 = KACC 11606]|uniref:LacI family transcriptional regulator n=2 Tax=Deinococcus cellulosilyticus TaxID=401558 RepID=A0A511N854_DEIC1|nr:LacI family transcriptional regulator [Deinococcus cellulosilyticus NBRC 106333 = KACC 11606]